MHIPSSHPQLCPGSGSAHLDSPGAPLPAVDASGAIGQGVGEPRALDGAKRRDGIHLRHGRCSRGGREDLSRSSERDRRQPQAQESQGNLPSKAKGLDFKFTPGALLAMPSAETSKATFSSGFSPTHSSLSNILTSASSVPTRISLAPSLLTSAAASADTAGAGGGVGHPAPPLATQREQPSTALLASGSGTPFDHVRMGHCPTNMQHRGTPQPHCNLPPCRS